MMLKKIKLVILCLALMANGVIGAHISVAALITGVVQNSLALIGGATLAVYMAGGSVINKRSVAMVTYSLLNESFSSSSCKIRALLSKVDFQYASEGSDSTYAEQIEVLRYYRKYSSNDAEMNHLLKKIRPYSNNYWNDLRQLQSEVDYWIKKLVDYRNESDSFSEYYEALCNAQANLKLLADWSLQAYGSN